MFCRFFQLHRKLRNLRLVIVKFFIFTSYNFL
uniref:Uncharacterized protein n=1 Tax=Bacteriophage sp. TaxID=38018 RepID=A0A8D9UHJ6_9VIRU|nr:MAG TPA: hypothetical protein [Bacteriophage sp.]